jgi:hypothetical protein
MSRVGVGIISLLVAGILCGNKCTADRKYLWDGVRHRISPLINVIAIAGVRSYSMVIALNARKNTGRAYQGKQT